MAKSKKRAETILVDIADILDTTDTHVTIEFANGQVRRVDRECAEFMPGMVQLPKWYHEYLMTGAAVKNAIIDIGLPILFCTGALIAGSDGGWFPWINLAGACLVVLVGLATLIINPRKV